MHTTPRLSRAVATPIAAAVLLAAASCAPIASGPVVAGGATDGQVVAIAVALNQGEVTTNQPAMSKATQAGVRQFAQRMVTDHSMAVDQLQALGIAPAEHPLSAQLTRGAQQTADVLQRYQGAAFDRAHMDSQITLHQYALDLLDQYLIPSARNARLRTLLQQSRAVVQTHLDLARQVRGALPGS